MKRLIATSFLLLFSSLPAVADPSVPWARPQDLPPQQSTDKPLFERVMEEERRRKNQGFDGTVDSSSLAPTKPTNQQQKQLKQPGGAFKPLARGANGADVEAAQNALLSLGFALPAGADGDFGGQTESAIKAFQSSANLPLTGKLDSATYQALTKVAPPAGKMIWEDSVAAGSLPAPAEVSGKRVRAVIDLSEHRISVYDSVGRLQRVFPVASGTKSLPTHPGVKVVCEKMADPTALAQKLWPKSGGLAFGKRLIDLNWYDPASGAQTVSDEELHGTYETDSIGSNASHGCVRVNNDHIEWLYQNLQLGDVVVVRE